MKFVHFVFMFAAVLSSAISIKLNEAKLKHDHSQFPVENCDGIF